MSDLLEGASDVLQRLSEGLGSLFDQNSARLVKLDEETSLQAADRLIRKWREIKLLPDACAAHCLASQVEGVLNELCQASGREPDQATTSGYLEALKASNGSSGEEASAVIDANVACRIAQLEEFRGSLLYGPQEEQDLAMKWLNVLRDLLRAHCSDLGDRADRLPNYPWKNPFQQGQAGGAGMVLREPSDFLLDVLQRAGAASGVRVPRDWIFQRLSEALRAPGRPSVCLFAPPGFGKSNVAAELVLDAGRRLGTPHVLVAYYFCSRREGGHAYEFVLQISEQLQKTLQPYSKLLMEDAGVKAHLNPIRMQQTGPRLALERGVLEPLAKLPREAVSAALGGDSCTALIVFDALNEALHRDGRGLPRHGDTVVDLLVFSKQYLARLGWIQVLCTSQNDTAVEQKLLKPPHSFSPVHIRPDTPQNIWHLFNDMEAYLEQGAVPRALREDLLTGSGGIFLVLRTSVDFVAATDQKIGDDPSAAESLPALVTDMESYHRDCFSSRFGDSSCRLFMSAQPVFGVLMATIRPLNTAQLLDAVRLVPQRGVSGKPRELLSVDDFKRHCLDLLRPFVEQRHDGTWSLYHDSLSAWLQSLRRDDPFFCDEAAGHRALAARLLRILKPPGGSWEEEAARVLDFALPPKEMQDCDYPAVAQLPRKNAAGNAESSNRDATGTTTVDEQVIEAQFQLLQHLTLARVEEAESANLLARSRLSFNVAGWINWLGNTQHGSVVHRVAIQGTPAMLRVLMSCHGLLARELGSHDAGSLLDPNLMTEKGKRTPLYMAVCCGHREMVREMIRFQAIRADQGKRRPAGRQVDKRIKYTPLHAAAQKLQLSCVEELVKSRHIGPIMKCQTPSDGLTALMLAARQPEDQGNILRLLLDTGKANVNKKDKKGLTALWHAVRKDNTAAVRVLLSHPRCGGEVRQSINDEQGQASGANSMLSYAAFNGYHGILVELLACEGINPDLANTKGETPLMVAAKQARADDPKSLRIFEILLQRTRSMPSAEWIESNFQPGSDVAKRLASAAAVAPQGMLEGEAGVPDRDSQQDAPLAAAMLSEVSAGASGTQQQEPGSLASPCTEEQQQQQQQQQQGGAFLANLCIEQEQQQQQQLGPGFLANIFIEQEQQQQQQDLPDSPFSPAGSRHRLEQVIAEGVKDVVVFPNDDIRILKGISRGGFGAVYLATLRDEHVAVKEILAAPGFYDAVYIEQARALLQEARIMRGLQHPNIVQIRGIQREPLRIVMDYVGGGSLFHLLHGTSEGTSGHPPPAAVPLSFPTRLKMALQIAEGMAYMYSLTPPVAHLDLKTPNVLVDAGQQQQYTLKIADFGLSKVAMETMLPHTGGGNGTPAYMAPEVFRGEQIGERGEKVDVFSFGVILWEIATRVKPYRHIRNRDPNCVINYHVAHNNKRPSDHEPEAMSVDTPQGIIELIERCWATNPESRPKFWEIVRELHQYVIPDAAA